MESSVAYLEGWLPIRLYLLSARLMVDWCYLGDQRLTHPFFEQTVATALRHPFQALFRHQTPIDTLIDLAEERPGVPPAGFIFHLSRCGSTLISQMLAALPQHLVLSEPPPLNVMLGARRRDPQIDEEQQIAWLRALVAALCQPRGGQERLAFIKFDSWNVLDLSLIRRVFPQVPWIFLYRDPVEVLVSHQTMPGMQMIPGTLRPDPFGIPLAVTSAETLLEYGALVLARICAAALEHIEAEGGVLVNYSELPAAVETVVAPLFGLRSTPEEQTAMRQATGVHAKDPHRPFVSDADTKRRAAPAQLRRMVERHVGAYYARLEELRRCQIADRTHVC
ncbi:MAG TPA: sulfotransferase [Roseiflexaceae bacterium]|nr:sulfotransferase [Roseiflexaceae bacterium]